MRLCSRAEHIFSFVLIELLIYITYETKISCTPFTCSPPVVSNTFDACFGPCSASDHHGTCASNTSTL
jgi:hypothetical protein